VPQIASPFKRALEPKITDIGKVLEQRQWTFRNCENMNFELELVRLRLNRIGNERQWTTPMRKHLDTNGGDPVARAR
jgi:hypothetical protein